MRLNDILHSKQGALLKTLLATIASINAVNIVVYYSRYQGQQLQESLGDWYLQMIPTAIYALFVVLSILTIKSKSLILAKILQAYFVVRIIFIIVGFTLKPIILSHLLMRDLGWIVLYGSTIVSIQSWQKAVQRGTV